jgi:hypothetical protein
MEKNQHVACGILKSLLGDFRSIPIFDLRSENTLIRETKADFLKTDLLICVAVVMPGIALQAVSLFMEKSSIQKMIRSAWSAK